MYPSPITLLDEAFALFLLKHHRSPQALKESRLARCSKVLIKKDRQEQDDQNTQGKDDEKR